MSDEESPLLQTFLDDFSIKLWRDCCHAAEECCQKMTFEKSENSFYLLSHPVHSNFFFDLIEAITERCPATWDGWQCWPGGGTPGQVEYSPCPNYIYFHSVDQFSCGSKNFSYLTEKKILNFFLQKVMLKSNV